ncbi:MAG: hypothetical protein ACQERT_12545 [Thermodesulfobacteriota bacterium]
MIGPGFHRGALAVQSSPFPPPHPPRLGGSKKEKEKRTAKALRAQRKNRKEEKIFPCWVNSRQKTLPASGYGTPPAPSPDRVGKFIACGLPHEISSISSGSNPASNDFFLSVLCAFAVQSSSSAPSGPWRFKKKRKRKSNHEGTKDTKEEPRRRTDFLPWSFKKTGFIFLAPNPFFWHFESMVSLQHRKAQEVSYA